MEVIRTCRACLKISDHMEALFSESGTSLIQKFEFLSIKLIQNEDLPSSICEFCKSKLLVAYQFAQEVVNNEKELLKKLPKIVIEEIEIIDLPLPESEEVVFSIEVPSKKSPKKLSVKKKSALHLDKSIKTEKIVTNGKTVYKKECPICHSMQQNLKQHLLVHSGVRKYKCKICAKSFSQVSNLNNHVKLHEDAKERHKCEQCDTTFSDPRSLKRHEAKHTGERKYKCDLCSKGFLYSHNLLSHKRSHLQDKRYKCQEDGCEKAFVTGGELIRHTKRHKNKEKS